MTPHVGLWGVDMKLRIRGVDIGGPSGVATFLVTDIEGSTRRRERLGRLVGSAHVLGNYCGTVPT
jgi:class 3 adenylate cyclase